jgi:cell division protein FtsA
MAGMVQAAEAIFELPVRLGTPQHISGLADLVHNPTYTTGVGLALYGRDRLLAGESIRSNQGGVSGLWQRLSLWWQNFF